MKNIKKLIAVLITVMLVMSTMPLTAFAADDGFYDSDMSGTNDQCSWSYTASTHTLYIDGSAISGTNHMLPTYTLDEEGNKVRFNTDIEHLVFGSNVSSIANYTYCYDTQNNVEDDSPYPSLQSVVFEEGCTIQYLDTDLFSYAKNLKSVVLPDGLESIYEFCFTESGLESIEIPDSVYEIGESAFALCKSLETVKLPSYTGHYDIYYGGYIFGESAVRNVDFGTTILFIPQEMFYGCLNLGDITFPESVAYIDNYAFACTRINSVNTSNVETIENNAFTEAIVDNMTISGDTTRIRKDAFNCALLGNFVWEEGEFNCTLTQYAFSCTQFVTDCDEVWIADDCRDYAADIVIPSSVVSIPRYCFTEIFAGNVTFNVLSYEDAEGEDGLKTINSSAFSYAQLKGITLPRTVETINTDVLNGAEVELIDLSQVRNLDCIENYFTAGNSTLETIILPESLEEIGSYAFKNCTRLSKILTPATADLKNSQESIIDFPEDLCAIGYEAFRFCSSLTGDVEINKLQWIDDYAFANTNIHSVTLRTEEGIGAVIYQGAFSSNHSLVSASLPDEVEFISENLFYNCDSLTSINIPANTFEIEDNAFKNCTSLAEVDFSRVSGTFSIGKDAFRGCTALTHIELPEGTKTIGQYAFAYCSNLSEVATLSKNIATIDAHAFTGTAIHSLAIKSMLVTINSNFMGNRPSDFKFYGYAHSTVSLFCVEENIPFGLLDGQPELPDTPENVSYYGTWENGTWSISETTPRVMTIIGSGVINPQFTLADTSYTYTAYELAKQYGVKTLNILGDITVIPDNFMYDEETDTGSSITSVRTPSSLVKIGKNAFRKSGLAGIVAPASLKVIDDGAFRNCAITSVNFDNSTDLVIGEYAFASQTTTNFKTLTIKKGVSSIGSHAFSGNSALTTLDLSGVKTICSEAFMDSKNVASLKLTGDTSTDEEGNTAKTSSSVQFIGDRAFYNTGIKSVIIPNTVTYIGEYAFAKNASLATLKFEEGTILTQINEGVFYDTGLKSVVIPYGVVSIGAKAFGQCPSLVTFQLPRTLESIYYDEDDKSNCAIGFRSNGNAVSSITINGAPVPAICDYADKAGLKFVIYDSDADAYGTSIADSIHGEVTKASWVYYEDIKSVYISSNGEFAGDGVQYADETFVQQGDLDVDYVYFYGVVTLGKNNITADSLISVFNPKYIKLSETLEFIDGGAFKDCTRLETIKLPDSLTQMGSRVFENCTSLKSVKFGQNLNIIPEASFKNNKSLQFVDFGGVKTINRYAFQNCTNLAEIILPDSITAVDAFAFNKCLSVNHIKIGSGLSAVGNYAFANMPLCDKIEINSDSFNEGMYTGNDIFKNTGFSTSGINFVYGDEITTANLGYLDGVNVSKITFGKNVDGFRNLKTLDYLQEIKVDEENENVFAYHNCLYSCSNELIYVPQAFTVVDIMPATEKIGSYAFKNSKVVNIKLPNGLCEIGDYAFYGCKTLKRVSFPERSTLSEIGRSAFEGCESLKSVIISKPVETIGEKAFKNCKQLTSIILPDSLRTIGIDAFASCSSLTYIVVPEEVETINSGAFSYCENLEEIYIFYNTNLNYRSIYRSPKVNIHTIAASPAYVYARGNKIAYTAYTDDEIFYDIAMMKLDVIAGYLGYCTDGHSDIEYLTVYQADCENDGYVIGVCEYCSEILEEVHTQASGHNYQLTADIPATAVTRGMTVYTCHNCNQTYCNYTPALDSQHSVTMQTVSGKVVIALNKNADTGKAAAKGASIIIDGYTVATADESGAFSFELETGSYIATVHYNYGFDRVIYIIVEDSDIDIGLIPVIGCDWTKDGKIDDDDLRLFSMVASSQTNDLSYLPFVDINNDGNINGKDLAYIRGFLGISSATYEYQNIVARN